ncbi:hypothetical protein [Clostridium rectalis]|uniref:hypothetical protein n=1 Tax=Clostridium rectalis TaxID=2040295 RepID=UPI001FAA47E2|nr:hypothetical protein [Clostridium rectalis]
MYIDGFYRNDELNEDFYENYYDKLEETYKFQNFTCPFQYLYGQFSPPPRPPMPPPRPPMPPGGGGGGRPPGRPPSGRPPSYIPNKSPGIKAVNPGSLRPCLYRFVYIWPRNGRGFWAWIVFVGRNSVSGWRWTGRRWIYFGMDLRRIESFVCI